MDHSVEQIPFRIKKSFFLPNTSQSSPSLFLAVLASSTVLFERVAAAVIGRILFAGICRNPFAILRQKGRWWPEQSSDCKHQNKVGELRFESFGNSFCGEPSELTNRLNWRVDCTVQFALETLKLRVFSGRNLLASVENKESCGKID